MNTFLPFADFAKSAQTLDRARLGKQRVEAYQLLLGQWSKHPASKMWKGYEAALAFYGYTICLEWIKRGYKDTCWDKLSHALIHHVETLDAPPWLGDERLHSSHRAALLHKNTKFYSQYKDWTEEPKLDYFWPVTKEKNYDKTSNRSTI